ncbi:MAG TPA: MBL fold metallo-hydrolase, partial [Anaerolineae bacterium]|nr:MBL fold metallo-hydrolase [Anaerolineae bacterium]
MQATQHGQYLIQLTRWWVFNCYFVREEDGLTLIDSGLPGSAKAIMTAAASLAAPIRRIALTHAHGDHVGSLDALAAALPKVEILFTARTARFLAGDLSLDADEPQAKLRGSFPRRQTQASRYLQPGERVGSLEVIAAPGHSPDQVAFFDRR